MIDWVAVDWGTSSLRAYAMDGQDNMLEQRSSDTGMGKLEPAGFEPALLALINDWLPQGRATTVLACGMVGSKQGWHTAPYSGLPCTLEQLQRVKIDTVLDPRLDVQLIGGVCQSDPADVMRGEETQIAGLLHLQQLDSALICLPGTHCKWARINNAAIDGFDTYMTGETFAALSQHTVLKHDMDLAQWDNAAFLAGVEAGFSNAADIGRLTFNIRARGLLDKQTTAEATARLSGMLIGIELASTQPCWQHQTVNIVGDDGIARHYADALTHQGASVQLHDASRCTLAGLTSVFRRHNSSP